ncbi:BRISC and BRCA1-A complex member 2, partial [Clarias magur]
MNSLSPELALSRMSPELRPLLCTVVRNGRVGLDSTNCLRVTDLKSGCTSLTPGPCCDRFKLHIPYAGETLKWDIIFNARDPELPPDFIFGEDAEFLPEPSELPHLVAWDAGDPECLLQLVKELLQQYHQYQCQRLRDSSRLLFEYDSLLEDPNYGRSMEIYAGRKNSWTKTTRGETKTSRGETKTSRGETKTSRGETKTSRVVLHTRYKTSRTPCGAARSHTASVKRKRRGPPTSRPVRT